MSLEIGKSHLRRKVVSRVREMLGRFRTKFCELTWPNRNFQNCRTSRLKSLLSARKAFRQFPRVLGNRPKPARTAPDPSGQAPLAWRPPEASRMPPGRPPNTLGLAWEWVSRNSPPGARKRNPHLRDAARNVYLKCSGESNYFVICMT